jgi:hypothetical protein
MYIQTHKIQPKKQEGSLKSKGKQQEWAEKADLIGPSQFGKRCATKLPRHLGRLSAQKVVSRKINGYFVLPTG